MYILWQLVVIAVISAGSSRGSNLEDFEELNKEEARQIPFLTSTDVLAETKFKCRDKPSGYYADPRFDCKVFHYCQEDGSKVTIPCTPDGGQHHKICAFRDIAFNACEGSEIYLALPEDLDARPGHQTTDSAADNSASTDFKLSSVLPQPYSSSDANRSTTPLSLNLERRSGDDFGSIFEVFNTVLREVQTENFEKFPASTTKEVNLSPSTFSRGSKSQPSSEESRKKDINPRKEGNAYLVEVYHKKDDTSPSPVLKKSKRLFFLPKVEKETPAVHPRRKKRTVVEALDVRQPYAIIYTQVPDNRRVSKSKTERMSESLRKDLSQVPFVAARVPVDVPTVPIAIETRRKKKSKSKKSKSSPETQGRGGQPAEKTREQTSEQQNILLFAAEPIIGLESISDKNVVNSRLRPSQDTAKQAETQYRNNGPTVQNPLQGNYQTLTNGGINNPPQIPGIQFQSPTGYLTNSATPQFYLQPQEIQQPGNFPSFNLYDQISFQPNQPQVLQPNAFQPPNAEQPQTGNASPQARQPDSNSQQRPRQSGQLQTPDRPQPQRQQNIAPQITRPAEDGRQTNKQAENSRPSTRLTDSVAAQTIRQPEIILEPHGQVPHRIRNQPDNHVQPFRPPGNVQQYDGRNYQILQPEGPQAFNLPEGAQIQSVGQPDGTQPQTQRHPQSVRSQTVRQRENILPHSIRQPEDIQPQSLRQLQNIYLQNVPTFTLGQPEPSFPQRQSQAGEQGEQQNERDRNKIDRERLQGPQPIAPSQIYPGFENAFFQEFPGFGPLTYDGPYSQGAPGSFDLFAPPGVRFQEQVNPQQQHADSANRARPQSLQASEEPKAPFVPQDVSVGRPLNPNQYGNPGLQPNPEIRRPEIGLAYPVQNPNLAEAERAKQERERIIGEYGAPPSLSDVRESPRSTTRGRHRPTPPTDSHVRPSAGERNYGPQNAQHHGRPQENGERTQQHPSNYNRGPSEPPRPSPETSYRPHFPPEREIPNEIRHQPPTTVEVPNVRLQERPQAVRESPRDSAQRQRQPPSQRNRQYYYYDGGNGQAHREPHHTTYQYARTTASPQPPRQRTRQPEIPPSRERFRQDPRETNNGEQAPGGVDRPTVERTRTRTPPERQQSPGVPVTNRYFVTTAPRPRPPEDGTRGRRPQYLSEIPDERSRHQAQIERPPSDYASAEPLREEYPRPQRYNSNRVPNNYQENDVNVVSTAEDPSFRHQTTPSGYERPGYRGTSHNRYRPSIEIEHGFKPVSERPQRQQSYTTKAPERQRFRTPDEEYSHSSRSPDRERVYSTRAPERQRSRTPDEEHSHSSRSADRERVYSTRAPERQRSRTPEEEYSHSSRSPDRERVYSTRAPQRGYSYETRSPENGYAHDARAPEKEYANQRLPEREYPRTTRPPVREYAYNTRTPEDTEYSYTTRSPGRERLHATRSPVREHSYTTQTPNKEYPYPPRVPEREYRDPDVDGTRGSRNQNYKEEAPTTREVTTPRPTTKKPRPPPPRPTFPSFPTFPPPPRRVVTSPRPKTTEAPPENELLRESDNDYTTEHPVPDGRRSNAGDVTDAPEARRRVTDNHVTTDEPEVTTRRRSRKRRPRPRRPKATTTTAPYSDDAEEAMQVETITLATTNREVVTRSTPSNFNRWRQQTQSKTTSTTTTTPSTTTTTSGNDEKTEEYGSRINLFGRPRTRKATSFVPRTSTTTPASPVYNNDRKRVTKLPTVTRTRKPFVKKVRKKVKATTTTTTETPETTEPVARSDENDDVFHFDPDINFQELESATQLSVQMMEEDQQTTTTEAYNDMVAETTTEAFTEIYEETTTDAADRADDGTRSVLKKFQNRPRVLKFRKPRLRVTESPLDLK